MRNSDELIDLLSGADTDKNGTINYTGIKYLANLYLFIEFIAATIEAQVFLREENLRNAFIMFDRDGSGKIDAKELA
jgi:Ca2+-binding EF-hand superfamily protein